MLSNIITIVVIVFAAGMSWMSIKKKVEDLAVAVTAESTARLKSRLTIEKQFTKFTKIFDDRIKSLEDQIKKHDEIIMQVLKKKLA